MTPPNFDNYRRVEPILFKGINKGNVPLNLPKMLWVSPSQLLVDERYQRKPTARSLKILRKMVQNWDWSKVKSLIIVFQSLVDDKPYYAVIDGQHTAIGAITLNIPLLPCLLIDSDSIKENAHSFIAHNRDRTIVTPVQIYFAEITGMLPETLELKNLLEENGVNVYNAIKSHYEIGDTAAIGTLKNLIKKRGPTQFSMILQTCIQARLAPISAADLKAVDRLLWSDEYKTKKYTPFHIATAIRSLKTKGEIAFDSSYIDWSEKIAQEYKEILE